MSYTLVMWYQPERTLDIQSARKVFEEGLKGKTPALPSRTSLIDIEKNLKDIILPDKESRIQFIIHKDNFVIMTLPEEEVIMQDVLFYALNNDLLLYEAENNIIFCCDGRYGIGNYVFYHENNRIIENPDAAILGTELSALNTTDNTFAVLEGPVGYIQMSWTGNNMIVEWNRGNLQNHYVLDHPPMTVNETVEILEAFRRDETAHLEKLNWQPVDFSEEYNDKTIYSVSRPILN